MNNSGKRKYKFCVTITDQNVGAAPVLLRGDIVDCIRRAKDFGYEAVELHLPDPGALDVQAVADACKQYGMKVAGIATGATFTRHKLSLTDASGATRAIALKRLYEYVDIASALSGILIIGCVRGNVGVPSEYELIVERFRQSMQELSQYCTQKNVPIIIEAINRYENNYLNTAAATGEFIRSCHIPDCTILMDTFHMNIEEVDIGQSLLQHKDQLGYVHVADSNRLYPGGGHVDFKHVLDVLTAIDYDGYVSVECNAIPDGDTSAQKSIAYLQSLLA